MATPLRVVHDAQSDAADRYEVAKARLGEIRERRDAIAEQWKELGYPLLSEGSTRQAVEHPLVKMLREHETLLQQHEALLHKLSEPLRRRHSGPAPSAVVSASIGEAPSARLRQVR